MNYNYFLWNNASYVHYFYKVDFSVRQRDSKKRKVFAINNFTQRQSTLGQFRFHIAILCKKKYCWTCETPNSMKYMGTLKNWPFKTFGNRKEKPTDYYCLYSLGNLFGLCFLQRCNLLYILKYTWMFIFSSIIKHILYIIHLEHYFVWVY